MSGEAVAYCVTSFDDLNLPALLPSQQSFFNTLPWFRLLAETIVAPDQQLRIYVAGGGTNEVNSGQPGMLLPMLRQRTGGLFTPRRLQSLANYYSPLFAPIVAAFALDQPDANADAPGRSQSFSPGYGPPRNPPHSPSFATLAAALAAELPRWDAIDLHPLAISDPAYAQVEAAFQAAGMAVQRYRCFTNWYLNVRGRTFDTYRSQLPSQLRNTLSRKLNKLGIRLTMEIVVDDCDGKLDAHIAAYNTIYGASWKQAEAFPHFIRDLIRLCAKQGSLRLGMAHIDGVPAAAQLWIVHEGVASIVKLAYVARFSATSVGSILTAHLMQHVIDIDQVEEVDFLSGDDAYKKDWMSDSRERWGLIALNLHTARGILLAVRNIGGRHLKNFLRGITFR